MKASFRDLLRSAALAAALGATLLGVSACDDDDDGGSYDQPQPEPEPEPGGYDAYPEVRISDEAPSFNDDVELGTLLTAEVNDEQLTLYTFKNDTAGTSNCTINADSTGCAAVWPPLFAGENAQPSGDFTIITRPDGLAQWAWRDYPLYFFNGGTEAAAGSTPTPADTRTGDTNGFLFNNAWYVVRPDPFETITLNGETVFVSRGAILDFGDDTVVPPVTNPEEQFPTARTAARDGYTLYTFDNDAMDDAAGDDSSSCYTNGSTNFCSRVWPPLYADLGTIPPSEDFKIITRPNGTYQWQYKGRPLYHYVNDTAPAQTGGAVVFPTLPNGNTLWSLAFQTRAAFDPELSDIIANVFQSSTGGNCVGCHTAAGGSGGLELGGTQAEVLAELQALSGNPNYADKARTVPQSPDTSLLVHKIEGDAGYGNRMPLGGPPLAEDVIAAIRQWIANGARDE